MDCYLCGSLLADVELRQMKRLTEPFWWSLFGAGGVVSAFTLPALTILTGIAIPLGWVETPDHAKMAMLFQSWIARVVVLVIVVVPMFHWAHRFRFTLEDGLKLKKYDAPIATICYGIAIAVGALATYFMWTL